MSHEETQEEPERSNDERKNYQDWGGDEKSGCSWDRWHRGKHKD